MRLAKKHFLAILWLLALFAIVAPGLLIAAQDDSTIAESEFWTRIDDTITDAQQGARVSTNINTLILRIQERWQNVKYVHLDAGDTIPVDVGWIIQRSQIGSYTEFTSLADDLIAIRNKHSVPLVGIDTNKALQNLKDVLKNSRFHYEATPIPATPTPRPTDAPSAPSNGERPSIWVPDSIGQIALIASIIIAAVAAVAFIAQRLSVQTAAVSRHNDEPEPQTSDEAREAATTSETQQDYRTAIRYLYLASLLLLDERGLIRYDRTLTNREHLRQVADKKVVADALRPVVDTFDRVWYGFAPATEETYERFREAVDYLKSLTPSE